MEPADCNLEPSPPSCNTHKHKFKMSRPPYPQGLHPPSPWNHPPLARIAVPRLPTCKPIAGTWHPGAWWMHWVLLFGAPKWHPSENSEMDRVLLLGGCCSMGWCNNQPNDSVRVSVVEGSLDRWNKWGRTTFTRHFGQRVEQRNKKRERAMWP